MQSAEELAERGFGPGEELCMPLPYWDDDDDDDDPPPRAVKPEELPPPPPTAERVQQVLYSAPAHSHSERGMADSQIFRELRDAERGPFAIDAAATLRRVEYSAALTAAEFAEHYQASPCVLLGVPASEGWPAALMWTSEETFLEELGVRM